MSDSWVERESRCFPGEFPECGCHYTNDDDGIHFCPMHKAAPDLLAACKAAAVALTHECCCGGSGCSWTKTQRNHALAATEAAIAKAEGRSTLTGERVKDVGVGESANDVFWLVGE